MEDNMRMQTTVMQGSAIAALAVALIAASSCIEPTNAQSAPNSPYAFERGFPTRDAAQRARDDADLQRALVAYRFWYPTVSAEGIFNGLRAAGLKDNESMMIQVTGPRHVLFTPNSD